MKNKVQFLALGACLCTLSQTASAGVIFAVDGTLMSFSTAWSGTPTIGLATPAQGNVIEGGGTNGGVVSIAFLASSSFLLGEVKFESAGLASSTIGVSLYNLGATVAGGNPRYTIDGNSVNLLSPGLNYTYASAGTVISSLTFTDSDQVALTAGNWYALELLNNNLATNFLVERASTSFDSFLGLGSGATGGRNNVPAGDRDPVAAIYAVPEPGSAALLGLGALIGLGILRRRN